MTGCPDILWRRLVGLAVCYLLALQAFLAALETAHAVAAAHALDPAIICHGAGGTSSSSPDQTPTKSPCAHCALAAAGAALLPAPAAVAAVTRWPAGTLDPLIAIAIPNKPPVRAGPARAPPRFA